MKTIIFSAHKCYPPSNTAHYFDGLKLVPGSKTYSDEEVETLLEHPDYPRYQAWGAIAILEPREIVEVQAVKPANDLSQYSADDAEKVIFACHDPEQLKAWLTDKRVTVRQMINRRLKAIAEGAE